MLELKFFELQDIKNIFGPLFVPFIPTLIAAVFLYLLIHLGPKGVVRQILGIISMVLIVAVYIYSTADTAMNW